MTRRRHNRAPLRRSSAPQKILASGLAAALCVGVVGVIGYRTMDAKADPPSESVPTEPAASVADDAASDVSEVTDAAPVVSTDGLTREQLDAYAAALAAEKHRLDVYRVQLIRAAKELQGATTAVGASAVQAGTVPASEQAPPAEEAPTD